MNENIPDDTLHLLFKSVVNVKTRKFNALKRKNNFPVEIEVVIE